AWWIASRHPEWGAKLSGFVRTRLGDAKLTSTERDDLLQQLVRLTRSPAIQTLVAEQVGDVSAPEEGRKLALRAIAQAGLKETPAAWLTALTRVLTAGDIELKCEAVATARALRWPKQRPKDLVSALAKVGDDEQAPAVVRLTALAALPDGLPKV